MNLIQVLILAVRQRRAAQISTRFALSWVTEAGAMSAVVGAPGSDRR
jgi:hypothetical protein